MTRQGLLLGFFSTAAQVLLLRELESSLNGSELFIGTALFGWLIAVAAGAYLGGKTKRTVTPTILFGAGALLLPLLIIVARLSPLYVTHVTGETIPFSTAALISILATVPAGILSGWLFTTIVRGQSPESNTITKLYCIEGVGAGIAGVLITLLAGTWFSTLAIAIIVAVITVAALLFAPSAKRAVRFFVVIGAILMIVLAVTSIPILDRAIDGIKYSSYRVQQTFDTPYSHEAILTRDNSTVLLTDNTVEATSPDLLTDENLLLPPFAYSPGATKVLVFGRTEFGIEQLASRLGNVSITSVDPRQMRGTKATNTSQIVRVTDDPLAFVSRTGKHQSYDIIILPAGDLGSYRNSRLISKHFLGAARRLIAPKGIIFIPTRYDSDRYISAREQTILSTIYATLRETFPNVQSWPGNMTLFFASYELPLDLPYDSLISNLSRLSYIPQFIGENYLKDRLDSLKVDRLVLSFGSSSHANSLNVPLLTLQETLYRSELSKLDAKISAALLDSSWWLAILPILIVTLFFVTVIGRKGHASYGLFLYFCAGVVSLTLEMIAFYVYQSTAGSLYSELAILIGIFMFGLSAGTYLTLKSEFERVDLSAIIMLLTATTVYTLAYKTVPSSMLLIFHILFLLTIALGTGSLFAAATRRYYGRRPGPNQGAGYALELTGSSLGAVLTTTVLLPAIGLHWLLVGVILLLAIAAVGSILTARGSQAN